VNKLKTTATQPMTEADYNALGIEFPKDPLANIEDVGAAPPKLDEFADVTSGAPSVAPAASPAAVAAPAPAAAPAAAPQEAPAPEPATNTSTAA